MGNTYECCICHGVFEKAIPDEEAMEETKAEFGSEVEMKDCGIVCDDCYKRII